MGSAFRLSESGQEIVDALAEVLDGTVCLFDAEKREYHFLMSSGRWYSRSGDTPDKDTGRCHMTVPINDRWTLGVFRRGDLHRDAETIAIWAVKKLAVHLRRRAAHLGVPPGQGGGGTSGSAELGIPLWWVRKDRN